jgi:hypothetical protein
MERVDESLLPAVYLYVACSFGATPAQLGSITFLRALVQALASPLGGVLGELCQLDRNKHMVSSVLQCNSPIHTFGTLKTPSLLPLDLSVYSY